jgi:uncharacterized membrane protein
MKLFGHPVHLMLVHFPSAFIPFEVLFYGLSYISDDPSFKSCYIYSTYGIVITGWLTILTGLMDLVKIKDESKAKKGLIHGSINSSVIFLYTIYGGWLIKYAQSLPEETLSLLFIKICLVLLLFLGNFLGGNLVLKEKIGVSES